MNESSKNTVCRLGGTALLLVALGAPSLGAAMPPLMIGTQLPGNPTPVIGTQIPGTAAYTPPAIGTQVPGAAHAPANSGNRPSHRPASADCQLLLGDTRVDYGTLSRSALDRMSQFPAYRSFGKRIVTVTALCPQATHMTLWLRGAPSPNQLFRFGEQNGFSVTASHAQLDGHPIQLASVAAPGLAPAAPRESNLVKPGQGLSAAGTASTKGQRLTLQLEVQAYVSDSAARVTGRLPLDGAVDLELTAER